MGFFTSRDENDRDEAETRKRIERGRIPLGAERRLQDLGADGSLFTSALSVNEFALLRRMGPQPLAQVMGASVVRTGWQFLPPLPPGEIVTQWGGGVGYFTSQAAWLCQHVHRALDVADPQLPLARDRGVRTRRPDRRVDHRTTPALDRLREEALQVGADAVVGVHLHRGEHDLGRGTIEYVVSGTAVRLADSTGATCPVITDLSVQDYWRLHSAGHEPVGFLATTAVMFASPPVSLRLQRARTIQRNQELDELSQAFRIARETVRARLEDQLSDAHGVGAVGVRLSHSIHRDKLPLGSSLQTAPYRGWNRGRLGLPYYVSGRGDAERRGWVIAMHAAGTAIRPRSGPSRVPREADRPDGSHVNEYEPGSLEGVPQSGRERLEQNRQGLYTSDLTVNEFLLVTEAGFDPVGLVVGSSIFHIGFQVAGPTTSRELDVLSQAMYSARHLAMTRMEEEADQLGADGIVGVRLDIGRYEWGANMAEFIAIGTAVKHREGVLHRAPNGRPFQSDLSGQEFWTLLRTGHRPVGMVMGNCVYHVGRRGPLRTMSQTGRNVELPNYTQALYEARELAMQRMQTEAQELEAEGVVGVTLSEKSHGWGSHVIEFFAIGTAIIATGGGATGEPPIPVLDLNDR